MVCCAAIALILGMFGLPFARLRSAAPLAWRPGPQSYAPSLVRSFGHAFAGISLLVREERNARIHLAGAAAAIAAGVALGIGAADWRWIVLAIGLVLAAEALNTAIERVCDLASPGRHPLVKAAKDVAAGAVLLLAATAASIALLTFAPYALAHSTH